MRPRASSSFLRRCYEYEGNNGVQPAKRMALVKSKWTLFQFKIQEEWVQDHARGIPPSYYTLPPSIIRVRLTGTILYHPLRPLPSYLSTPPSPR
jgi:hypothetical protein